MLFTLGSAIVPGYIPLVDELRAMPVIGKDCGENNYIIGTAKCIADERLLSVGFVHDGMGSEGKRHDRIARKTECGISVTNGRRISCTYQV